MTRSEHMQWCKQRALEYLKPGPYFDIDEAIASMASDVRKHPETAGLHSVTVGLMLQMRAGGQLDTAEKTRAFIQGFA